MRLFGVRQQYPTVFCDSALLSQNNRFGLLWVWVIDCAARQAYRPHRSKRRKIYGSDAGSKLHLLVIILSAQASMKNQRLMMTQFQRFLATLSRVSSPRGAAPRFCQQTRRLPSYCFNRGEPPPNGLTVNFPLLAPGGPDMRKLLLATRGKVFTSENINQIIEYTRAANYRTQ